MIAKIMSICPIVSIVGRSDSGKTTLLEGLITELKQRGYRVAVIKHSADDLDFEKAIALRDRINKLKQSMLL